MNAALDELDFSDLFQLIYIVEDSLNTLKNPIHYNVNYE